MYFRDDIQALRAIAVLLVVGFHMWPTVIRGGFVGVDVFFVISGYLITGHLMREVASTGRVDLPTFYARRVRRLLPAASLTLLAVGLAAYLWMPAFTSATTAADMAASTLYVENWMLVHRSVDYLAVDETPSPLQHFWSLAVEEQFYLGWPLLVAGVAAWWKRGRLNADRTPSLPGLPPPPPSRRAYALPMGIVSGLSFVLAVHYVSADPAAGYFMTHVRLYELGLGGSLAVWLVGWRRPADQAVPGWAASFWSRTLIASAGLAAIGASGAMYTTGTPFPGTAALVPILGAAGVIVAGETGASANDTVSLHALTPVLAHPWLQYFGEISYSLYLAHWPVIVVYPFATGRAVDATVADSVTVLAISWALAHACKWTWEDRFRWETAFKAAAPDDGLAKSLAAAPPPGSHGLLRGAGPIGPAPINLTGTFGATLLTMAAVVGLAFWLHQVTTPVQASIDEPTRQVSHPHALITNNHTASACRPCPFFSGQDASDLYPGAEAVLHGCPILNSLPLSAVRPSISAKPGVWPPPGYDHKHYPCFQGPSGKTFNDSRPQCETKSKHASACAHLVLIGDSHAGHFQPAFDIISRRMGFRFTLLGRAGCPPTATPIRKIIPPSRDPDVDCQHFVNDAIAWVLREQPSVVVLSSHNIYRAAGEGVNDTDIASGVVDIAKRLIEAGIPVVGIKGTPTMKESPPACLSKELARTGNRTNVNNITLQPTACSVPRSVGLVVSRTPGQFIYPINMAARMYPILRLLSLDDILCPGGMCTPIIGNVLVYGDRDHLTTTFAQSLANVLEKKLRDAAPHLESLCNRESL